MMVVVVVVVVVVVDLLFTDRIMFNAENRAKLTSKDLVRYATGICKGLNHISKEGIVHRDIAWHASLDFANSAV